MKEEEFDILAHIGNKVLDLHSQTAARLGSS